MQYQNMYRYYINAARSHTCHETILMGNVETYICAQMACRLTQHRVRFRQGTGMFNPNKINGPVYSHLKSKTTDTAVHISMRTQEFLTAALWSLMGFIS